MNKTEELNVNNIITNGWLKTSSITYKRQMIMLQEGHVLIGSAKYKGKKIHLCLHKVPELEEIQCLK